MRVIHILQTGSLRYISNVKPMPITRNKIAMAVAAHPDDIEFYMAGTLMLLGMAGFELHYMNLSSGNCGSATIPASKLRPMRKREAQNSARMLGAIYHPSLVDDLEIFYDLRTVRRLAAAIRDVKPSIILTHAPRDYMEDHTNTSRLVVTAAFARGMPNFKTIPASRHGEFNVTVYHAMPHGLVDGMRQPLQPDLFINTASVMETKTSALAAHRSQKEWLDVSQGMDSYLKSMQDMSRRVGKMSGKFRDAEAWLRHSHLGFSDCDDDPLKIILPRWYLPNRK